ncbi:MAG: DUF2167 domain-containing protein [Verrucomicrobia bacterium]|nr:DUF2167 domain-containing protein [Verrucomicrobiota bacterium]
MKFTRLLALCLLAALCLRAETPPPIDPAARFAEMRKVADTLKYQEGEITLKGNMAKVVLPPDFRYLNSNDTATVLTRLWGNPPSSGILGMITSAHFDPLAGEDWAVIITYAEDGYVKDDDAAKIDYAEMLKQMQEGALDGNKEREKQGFEPIQLIGWAAPPRYDASAHKLYWAKEIQFGDSPQHTLNYNIRILGRRGVLVLNAIASMPQLQAVEAATPKILSMVNFTDGNRYADFKSDTDKTATYGLAALVAGGIAAKTGLLKGLWILILAGKKFVIIAFIAIGTFFKRLFARRKSKASPFTGESTPPPAA